LSGRWSFASGCDNAQWSLCAALLPAEAEGGPLIPAFLLVRASDYSIDDTWNVVGLAGTGSKTLVLTDVFVPEHRVLNFADTTSGQTPGAALYAANLGFAVPMLCNIPSCLASTAVGAASGALDEYLARTSRRVTRGRGDNVRADGARAAASGSVLIEQPARKPCRARSHSKSISPSPTR